MSSKFVTKKAYAILKALATAYSISNLNTVTKDKYYLLLEKIHEKDLYFNCYKVTFISNRNAFEFRVKDRPTSNVLLNTFYKTTSEYTKTWWLLPYSEYAERTFKC